jgi:amidohydrolase
LEGTLRTFNGELRGELKDRITELSGLLASASGTGREIEWRDFAPVLVNHPGPCEEAAETAAALAGKDRVERARPRSLGGDDFAEFLLAVPGVYVNVGSGFPGKPPVPLHNCRFDLDEESLVYGAGIYAEYAAAYLGIPGGVTQ